MTLPDYRKQASDALTAASNRSAEIAKMVLTERSKAMTRPPLPMPNVEVISGHRAPFVSYDADQMREYGQQCREAALKDAAELCNGEQWRNEGKVSVEYIKAFNEGCADCEAAIRRLK